MTDAGRDPGAPRRRSRWWWVVVAAGVAAAVAAALTWSPGERTTEVDLESTARAPTFAVPDLGNPDRTIELAEINDRPVVLNFWASWCAPCRREMPAFQSMYEQYGGEVAFLGMNNQDSRRLALELLEQTGARYPSGYDPNGKIAKAYDLLGMPTTVFITADGRIAATRTGEMTRRELEQAITALLRR